jgi:hypothetical protein
MIVAVEFAQGIEDAWATVARIVPQILVFIAILVIGWFVAKAVGKVINAALEKAGFDRAVERGGIAQAMSRSSYDPSDLVGKVVFYGLLLIVLQIAFSVFGPNPVSDMIAGMVAYLPNVIAAIVIVVIAAAIASAVKGVIGSALGGLSYGRVLANVAAGFIVAFGVFAALNQLQIAPQIVNGLYYALLALIVGSGIIAIGGSGIGPMRKVWDRAIARVEDEAPKVREQARQHQIDLRDDAGWAPQGSGDGSEETVVVGSGPNGSGSQSGSVRRPPGSRAE